MGGNHGEPQRRGVLLTQSAVFHEATVECVWKTSVCTEPVMGDQGIQAWAIIPGVRNDMQLEHCLGTAKFYSAMFLWVDSPDHT